MSVVGLGERAVVGELNADALKASAVNVSPSEEYSVTGTTKAVGFHFLAPSGAIALALPDGAVKGDVVEFLHSGGPSVATITPSTFHGASVTCALTGGGYVKLVWGGTEWYLVTRQSSSASASNVVAGLSVIA